MEVTIFDYLKYNNTDYKDLKEGDDKDRVTKLAENIKAVGLENVILSFTPAYQFNARFFEHNGEDFISSFPQDLTNKLIVLWLHIDDEDSLAHYKKLFQA